MPFPLPPGSPWHQLLIDIPDEAPAPVTPPEEQFFAAIDQHDLPAVQGLLSALPPNPLLEGESALHRAIWKQAVSIVDLFLDNGVVLQGKELDPSAFSHAAHAGHLRLARALLDWGLTPATPSGLLLWHPENWIEKHPDFVRSWVTELGQPVTLAAESPYATRGQIREVQRAWLQFLPRHGTPELVDRVMVDCATDTLTPAWAGEWPHSVQDVWRNRVIEGSLDDLLGLVRLGMVPEPQPSWKAHSFLGLQSLLLTAIENGHWRVARWLARHPLMVEEAKAEWPTKGSLEKFFKAPPEIQDWLMTLPLDWTLETESDGNAVDVLFSVIEQDCIFIDPEDGLAARWMGWFESVLPRLGKVCPTAFLGSVEKHSGPWSYTHDFPEEFSKDKAGFITRLTALMEEGRLGHVLRAGESHPVRPPRL
jgi:hypothetical protein